MAWKENRVVETSTDIFVYQGATHGEHAGKLSALLTTRTCDVYGRGMNTLVTNSHFNRDYPMQEGDTVWFSSWIKVEKLCKQNIQKIIVGFGWGAATTKNSQLVIWGEGATTYLGNVGIVTVQIHEPHVACRFCPGPCNYPRRIGNTFFSYCKAQQTLVKYSSPPPPDVRVKKLGNRRYGALTCSVCLMDCDAEVVESCSFNFCNTCNQLWDVDESARPMNIKSVPLDSFIRTLDFPTEVRDIAPGQWGFWILSENRIKYSAFYMHPDTDTSGMPNWWKQPLSVPFLKPPHKIISIHSNKTDFFAITNTGLLYRRVEVMAKNKSNGETHTLNQTPLETGVRKMCCGRFASLCLLDDGTIWIIYSQKNRKDLKNNLDRNVNEQTDAEELLSGRGSHGCLDIAGISCADLFYVHTSKRQVHVRKKNPLTGDLIEILFGELDCKTFLWHFSGRCRVTNEGQIWYDEITVTQLINKQYNSQQQEVTALVQAQEEVQQEISDSSSESLPSPAQATVTRAGLGFPVGVTLWSSWGQRLAQMAAVGWQCFTVLAKRTFNSTLSTFKKIWPKSPHLGRHASSTNLGGPQVVLPPFQAGLYGKPQFADLTVQLRDGSFPAHRIVLCSTSNYFKTKLCGNKVDIKSLDMKMYNPRAYRCLLKYFYTIEPEKLNIDDMLDLFLLAKSYDERRVIFFVEESIKTMIDVDNVTKIMEVVTGHGSRRLKDECERFMKSDTAFREKHGTGAITASTRSASARS